ncbi:hypothetical protein [Thermogutta sp.]|uniref:hypothetical protein n=1 Tax=Thermogutta sp. TaxID=1962930 RepID=UPI00321F6660
MRISPRAAFLYTQTSPSASKVRREEAFASICQARDIAVTQWENKLPFDPGGGFNLVVVLENVLFLKSAR